MGVVCIYSIVDRDGENIKVERVSMRDKFTYTMHAEVWRARERERLDRLEKRGMRR